MNEQIQKACVTGPEEMIERDGHLLAYLIGSLTQDRLKELYIYEPETGQFFLRTTGREAGLNSIGHGRIRIDGCNYPVQSLAWLYVHGVLTMVDHKDRIKANNNIDNLRPTNYQLNAANRCAIDNNSGYKGVYKRGDKFEAGIKVNQKRIYLGQFTTAEEAYAAYKKAAEHYFGEFACG